MVKMKIGNKMMLLNSSQMCCCFLCAQPGGFVGVREAVRAGPGEIFSSKESERLKGKWRGLTPFMSFRRIQCHVGDHLGHFSYLWGFAPHFGNADLEKGQWCRAICPLIRHLDNKCLLQVRELNFLRFMMSGPVATVLCVWNVVVQIKMCWKCKIHSSLKMCSKEECKISC